MRPIRNFNFLHVALGLLFLLFLSTCKKSEIYPEIPSIEYKGAYFLQNQAGKDSLVVLIFSFKDGDGDLGLDQGDTMPPFNPQTDSTGKSLNPYYYNIYIDYKEFYNDSFNYVTKPFSSDTLRYAFRFQSLTPDGNHKSIRGDIEVKVESSPFFNAHDTVMYEFYIYDRALHRSNSVKSTPIVWQRQ